jgi:predicted nucleic acid-binding protein
MLYIDTSSYLKLLLNEPETAAVREVISQEKAVLVSSLTVLETQSQLRAALLGGKLSRAEHRKALIRAEELLNLGPFHHRSLSGAIFETALDQLRRLPALHCRSLDRLHLAAMEELQSPQLMTHDGKQATAALALGLAVLTPR